jgi:tripartite-type tricarboxylate transporter receptor subunit TctC
MTIKLTMTRRHFLIASTMLPAALASMNRSAGAQSYPAKPIRLIVGGAAGSVPDTLARLVGDRLSSALGQPIIVENRPGAAGAIAITGMLSAEPDGYTLAIATMSQAVFNSYLFSKLSYDPIRDLRPVAPLASGAMAIAASMEFGPNSFAEFLAFAKAHPGKVLVGTTQRGSPPNVFAHLLARAAGIEVAFVPYTSGAEGLTGVIRGDVQIFVDAPTIIAPQVRDGKIKALAVTGPSREKQLPDVPTVAEADLPAAQAEAWIGLVAPARTPQHVVERLNNELSAILANADFRQRLETLSFVPVIASPEQFSHLIREDHARWGAVIREAGIRLD